MIRNGPMTPLPNMFTRPPAWRIQTSRGSCGFRLRKYERTVAQAIAADEPANAGSAGVRHPTHIDLRSRAESSWLGASRAGLRSAKCAWQESNLRPCAPEAHALSPELQAR